MTSKKFICELCNYETGIKSNYNRHINTSTHQQLSKAHNELNEAQKVYICKCSKEFKYASGLSKHKKKCTFKSDNNSSEFKEVIELLKQLLNNQPQNITNNNNSNNNTNYKLSVKNYVQKNYPNAPALAAPSDYAKLTYENQELIDTLLFHYRHKALHTHLGEFIIGYYKKDDPALQSVWASDVSRLTYVIKESLAGTESIWNHDPKGAKTKKFIISPMLKHIRNYLDEYWDKLVAMPIKMKNGKVDVDAMDKRQNICNTIHEVKLNIDTDVLADDILKYIASYLHIDVNTSNKKIKKIKS